MYRGGALLSALIGVALLACGFALRADWTDAEPTVVQNPTAVVVPTEIVEPEAVTELPAVVDPIVDGGGQVL
jgi:hypothetical protein